MRHGGGEKQVGRCRRRPLVSEAFAFVAVEPLRAAADPLRFPPSRANTMSEILKDLRQQIAERRAVLVVGTGVCLAATGGARTASWTGLLESGVERCLEIAAGLPAGWKETRLLQIRSGDTQELISAAEQIVHRLGGRQSGDFAHWLRKDIGLLHAVEPEILEALVALGLPVATTNYDGLLEEAFQLPPVTWHPPGTALRVMQGEKRGILHLHGYWEEPTSVVLTARSYDEVLSNVPVQSLQQLLTLTHSLVFVGCDAGLADPNIGSLLDWLQRHWSGVEHRHFRLCLESEVDKLRRERGMGRVFPVGYGASHDDLTSFLVGLRSTTIPSKRAATTTPSALFNPSAPAWKRREWPEPPLPSCPYPLLLPYEHPKLLGGRDRELAVLRGKLDEPSPILGLFAVSGAGKSSLLAGGLVPRLRGEGFAVALDRQPNEPGLASRLIGDLLEREDGVPLGLPDLDRDPERFAELVADARRLTGYPPVLVLDQFEDLFRGANMESARATVGLLLAATARRLAGDPRPQCRWVLAYRGDFHYRVCDWMDDVLHEARDAGFATAVALPYELSGIERFQSWSLQPLGYAGSGARREVAERRAREAFQDAILRPLDAKAVGGGLFYSWRITTEDAARLADAFAEARAKLPGAPLVPQLQVVLAKMIDRASAALSEKTPFLRLTVPDNVGQLIESALEDHLRSALDRAFPVGAASNHREARSRALLALRELADRQGRGGEGLAEADLVPALGPEGKRTLEILKGERCRLIVSAQESSDEERYILSHDRLAEVVTRVVDEEARRGRLDADPAVLELRSIVRLQAQLYAEGDREASLHLSRKRRRAISSRAEALLFDNQRRVWWEACRARRRSQVRRAVATGAGLGVVGVVLVVYLYVSAMRWLDREAHLTNVEKSPDPQVVLESIWKLRSDHGLKLNTLRALLLKRGDLERICVEGLGRLPAGPRRALLVVTAGEVLMPAIEADPFEIRQIANLTWALDYVTAIDLRNTPDPDLTVRARGLRRVIEALLQRTYPLPQIDPREWVLIQAGSFTMGRDGAMAKDNESPAHRVSIETDFRMLSTEVTDNLFRSVFGEPSLILRFGKNGQEDDRLPALVPWENAYVFATLLGGRLPTEAEWEYAARASCPYTYCDRYSNESTIDRVAWFNDGEGGSPYLHAVGLKEPNPWRLHDMYGNASEWVVDWSAPYSSESQRDPWGPPSGEDRVVRGGSFGHVADVIGPTARDAEGGLGSYFQGFRVVLPGPPS